MYELHHLIAYTFSFIKTDVSSNPTNHKILSKTVYSILTVKNGVRNLKESIINK